MRHFTPSEARKLTNKAVRARMVGRMWWIDDDVFGFNAAIKVTGSSFQNGRVYLHGWLKCIEPVGGEVVVRDLMSWPRSSHFTDVDPLHLTKEVTQEDFDLGSWT